MRWSITYWKCDLFMILLHCKQFHPWLVSALLLCSAYVVRNALCVSSLCNAWFGIFCCISFLALNSYWVIALVSIPNYGTAVQSFPRMSIEPPSICVYWACDAAATVWLKGGELTRILYMNKNISLLMDVWECGAHWCKELESKNKPAEWARTMYVFYIEADRDTQS